MDSLLNNMTEDIYQRLVEVVESGKWFDGQALSQEQKEMCLQAVLAWQAKHNTDPEHFTVAQGGELHMKSKAELKQQYKEQIEIKQQD
ncbi:YeaC family protein [Motilimonas pumila]|uniref:DUF1315 family protein n=1 Tax=Motilimonas pumila TaxID=2303987 RepID=A0A418YG52_9GAMM|nr:DUF1315 family protein [Motilimonas pumila]RJG48447.1 DUF1315 family protein [Motilimonas pumila]